jgi:hypothetical protein
MCKKRPLILISNDDGYLAKGINELVDFLKDMADIIVVAPDGPRSGMACAITSQLPVTITLVNQTEGVTIYKCSGTPTDCIKLALETVLPRIPDIMPCPESAARQTSDMQEAIDWMLMVYDYSPADLIRYTDDVYLQRISHSNLNCVHPKVPHMSDYLLNLNSVVYSSLRLLCRPKYAKEDTSIVYWCCMYLRYCAPGLLDITKNNSDATERTMKVLNILHNEWQYLAAKYK